ncbi:MAG: nuclease-related domain-containing protein [Candidatus Nanopelagicaceae bacterium]|nr:nuclease-related domain-containing protein [Candidatus Nanopelagicaceae bacterium]
MNRKISVRRVDSCSECGAVIPIGSQAWWDPTQRILICLSHTDADHLTPIEDAKIQDLGTAGGSALAMRQKFHDRDQIKAKRDQEIFKISHPFLSRYITPKAQTSNQAKVWSKGAEGEVEVGKILNDLAGKYGFLAIHDRLMPRSKANIDHMAVTSTGIFIVDAKNYQGTIEVRGRMEKFVGGNSQLWIGKRNRTNLVDGVNKQILAVETVLENAGVKFPVFGALAFYKAKWDLPTFLRPNSVNGILVNSKGLEHIFEKMAPNDPHQVAEIAELLLSRLRPAS